jgi:hypothetical protein
VREATGRDLVEVPPHASEPVTTAVVAVAAGDGIKRIFYSLGVQGIVAGGQSMNPSTADLLAAVEAVPADQVVILPNNKNIIPVAEQVDAHTTRSVRVVPTRGIAEGFAALMGYDPEAPADENAKEMGAPVGQRGGRRGDPGGARLDQRRRPHRRGRLPGHRPRRHQGGGRLAAATPPAPCWRAGGRRARDRHGHRGRGGDRRRHPRITEWLDEHRPA